MPYFAGYITSLITNGRLSIKNWQQGRHTHHLLTYQNLAQHVDGNQNHQRLNEYLVTVSSGEEIYIAASDSMEAAYLAAELCECKQTILLDVTLTYGTEETLLPQ